MDFDDVAGSSLTKKELLTLSREKDKLERTLGGIRTMEKVPSAVWVVDTKKEHIAVKEARKLGIPVIAILDTNCDPDEVDYPVPGNDDAIRAVALLTRVIADAAADGLRARAERAAGGATDAEPLAEWEAEVLTGDAAAAEATAEPITDQTHTETPESAQTVAESAQTAEPGEPVGVDTSTDTPETPAETPAAAPDAAAPADAEGSEAAAAPADAAQS